MKKKFMVIMLGIMAIGIFGCGAARSEESAEPVVTENAETDAEVAAEEEKWLISMPEDNAPYCYLDEEGFLVGIDHDIINAIIEDQNADIGIYGTQTAGRAVEVCREGGANAALAGIPVSQQAIDEGAFFSDSYYDTVAEDGSTQEHALVVYDESYRNIINIFNAGLANIKANGVYDEIISKYSAQ